MSTAAEIIQDAFREGNFIALGEVPQAAEITEALPRLRSLIDSLFGFEIGEAYTDFYVPSELVVTAPLRRPLSPTADVTGVAQADLWKYPPPNSRLVVKTTTARTVYLPANPNDGARIQLVNVGSTAALNFTLDGNGHLIENGVSLTDTFTNLHGRKWFYRADLGDWVRLDSIAAEADIIPLPEEFDDLLVCGLAMRLAPRFQVPIAEETSSRYGDMLKRLKKRYRQTAPMPNSYGELRPTGFRASNWDI